MKTNATNTRDHHVPRMYLRRFAQHRPGGARLIAMTPDLRSRFPASINDVAVERGFYWGSDIDGVPHHDMEKFFTVLEADAAPALRKVLDTGKLPSEDALPPGHHASLPGRPSRGGSRRSCCVRFGSGNALKWLTTAKAVHRSRKSALGCPANSRAQTGTSSTSQR
ncbi:hypothetical protein Ade02nite_40510 [Paractinoplanes deccanensis]|uniref:DUF4238 domain-containing protein n=1 Tax=Paractinoplanes deccanensis TaxID=113561 RepID=A0ABQ3Y617_9ACTN|nr:DUF4238 domain-containing protein [Actinoplanes deccanensis]GID75410.1 hypothetical protein Ade02nite_40510 [Actinoplanes deccanensis]